MNVLFEQTEMENCDSDILVQNGTCKTNMYDSYFE